jgi:hypothetical protein
MMPLTPEHVVEEALRAIEDRAAMLRFFSDSIRQIDVVPERAFFSGLADSLGEIEAIARAVRQVLDVGALGMQLGSDQRGRRGRGARQS